MRVSSDTEESTINLVTESHREVKRAYDTPGLPAGVLRFEFQFFAARPEAGDTIATLSLGSSGEGMMKSVIPSIPRPVGIHFTYIKNGVGYAHLLNVYFVTD